jgi:hypothetical protein
VDAIRDPVHLFTDAGMLADELSNGRLLEADSLVVQQRLGDEQLVPGPVSVHALTLPQINALTGSTIHHAATAGGQAGQTPLHMSLGSSLARILQ